MYIEVWWPIRDLIEKLQNQEPQWKKRTNWRVDMKLDAFWHLFSFKWNDAFWSKRRRFMHFTKKRSKWCRVERHHKPSSSPGHVENRGRRSIFPLSPPKPKKPTTARLVPSLTPRPHAEKAIPCEQPTSSPYPAPWQG